MTKKMPKKKERIGVDRLGRTPLHYAAADCDDKELSRLLEDGQNPNSKDDDGWTPLHFATQANSVSIVSKLLHAGAEVDSVDNNGNTPLSNAVFYSLGNGDIITLLRASGADPFRENNYGVSPVKLARSIANYDIAQYFNDLS